MEKVKLTKEQAGIIESYRSDYSDENIIRWTVSGHLGTESKIYEIPLGILIKALYIGYEVELTVEEQLLNLYDNTEEDKDWVIKEVLDIIGMKVRGIND